MWNDSSQMHPYKLFPHSCHSAVICLLIPAYKTLSPPVSFSGRLFLAVFVPLSPSSCLDRSATCHSVTPRDEDGAGVCPFKLQTLSLTNGEKRGLGPRGGEAAAHGASESDKHQLAGDTDPTNPFKIFTSVPPATAAQCQRKNQGTGGNCGELSAAEEATCTIAFWCVLHLFVLSELLRLCLPDQLLCVAARRCMTPSFIYSLIQTQIYTATQR